MKENNIEMNIKNAKKLVQQVCYDISDDWAEVVAARLQVMHAKGQRWVPTDPRGSMGFAIRIGWHKDGDPTMLTFGRKEPFEGVWIADFDFDRRGKFTGFQRFIASQEDRLTHDRDHVYALAGRPKVA